MTQWRSVKAKKLLSALISIGWIIKRQSGSHRTLSRQGYQILYLPFMMEKK
jgi:predicted RNA binding protein YcfA (HicA-like mRNA interferase family)